MNESNGKSISGNHSNSSHPRFVTCELIAQDGFNRKPASNESIGISELLSVPRVAQCVPTFKETQKVLKKNIITSNRKEKDERLQSQNENDGKFDILTENSLVDAFGCQSNPASKAYYMRTSTIKKNGLKGKSGINYNLSGKPKHVDPKTFRRYRCLECTASFFQKIDLRVHSSIHQKNQLGIGPVLKTCKRCGYQMLKSEPAKIHTPYECEWTQIYNHG